MRVFNSLSKVCASRAWRTLLGTTLLSGLAQPIEAQVPADVVAYWKLDSGSGLVAEDETGPNDGALTNWPAWIPVGRIGGALTFDGLDDKVEVAAPVSLQQGAFAISAWVRYTVTGPNGGDVATMGDSYALRVQPNGDVKTFFYNGSIWNPAQSAGVDTKDGEWHHILGQYSGSQGSPAYHLQVWVDGILKDDKTYTGQSIVSRGPSFILGRQGTGGNLHNFTGTIDHVRVYARALTASEIAALYAEAPAIDPTVFTVLTWNLMKGRGTDLNSSLNTIADKIIIMGADVALLSALVDGQADTIKGRLGIKWTCTFYRITTEGQAICAKHQLTAPDQHIVTDIPGQTEPQAIVKATVTIGGRPVSFFAIDQQHNPTGQDLSEVRRRQAVDMTSWINSQPFPEPRIVGGDFNEASGPSLDHWQLSYYEGWLRVETQAGYPGNTSDGRTKRSRLDHIMVSTGATTIEAPDYPEYRVWDMRNPGTACDQVLTKLGSCTVCSSSPSSPSTCTWVDDTAVRPSDHIPLTMKYRFVQ